MRISNILSDSSLEKELILAHVISQDRSHLLAFAEKELTEQELTHFNVLWQRFQKHEPLAYILGYKEFYGRKFFVNKNVLVPRHETEDLVDQVLKHCQGKGFNLVDVGTGSGIVAITLKLENPNLEVTATDIGLEALSVARKNAKLFGLERKIKFIHTDLLEKLDSRVDIIVANLPYIPTNNWRKLPNQIKQFEPRLALDSGKSNQEIYRRLSDQAKNILNKDGKIFYELDGDVLVKDYSSLTSVD